MDEILGAMADALVPVAVQWSRYDDQTQQRVRNTRSDLRALRDAWQESLGWGGAVRSRLPIVMDWDTGLAMATSQQPTAQTIPTLPAGQLRPNLCSGAELANFYMVVRGGGLEPPQYCYRQDLNLVRLPISPPARL